MRICPYAATTAMSALMAASAFVNSGVFTDSGCSTGIFAVIAHAVTDRRREIGIRAALGASPVHLVAAISGLGARPALMGLVAGLLASFAVGRVLSAMVFGVRAMDPIVLSSVTALAIVVVATASGLAARRALGVNPAESLANA